MRRDSVVQIVGRERRQRALLHRAALLARRHFFQVLFLQVVLQVNPANEEWKSFQKRTVNYGNAKSNHNIKLFCKQFMIDVFKV